MKSQITTLSIATSDGKFIAHYSDRGLVELNFPSQHNRSPSSEDRVQSAQIRGWHRATSAAIKQVLAGHDAKNLPPLDLASGTDFQRAVWQALRQIRAGQTRSYGEVAQMIGRPKAVRAVGGACGANPIPVLVPCHRVLAAHQKLGGFSSGLNWKRRLLEREGVFPG